MFRVLVFILHGANEGAFLEPVSKHPKSIVVELDTVGSIRTHPKRGHPPRLQHAKTDRLIGVNLA